MGRFAVISAGLWLFSELILRRIFPPTALGIRLAYDLLLVLVLIPLVYYALRAGKVLKRLLLWKIRRRLILAHIFVAFIPILLLISIVLLSALLIYYQFSYYLVLNQLGLHTGQVEAYTLALRSGIDQLLDRPALDRSELRAFLNREAQFIQGNYPQASIHLQIHNQTTGESATFHSGFAEKFQPENYRVPGWLDQTDFSGLVFEPLEVGPLVKEGFMKKRARWSDLSIRAIAFSGSHPEHGFSVEVVVPLDRFFLKKLKAALGVDLLLVKASEDEAQTFDSSRLTPDTIVASTGEEFVTNPAKLQASPLPMHLYPILWETGKESPANRFDVLYMELSLTRLHQNLFLSESSLSRDISDILKFLLMFFLVAEVVSVFIGVVLTKSITTAVYNLDRGTEIVKRGDFSHRIIVKTDDQLGELAESFNKMIESVQSLMRERVEKERLERELEIAKEVQAQLFPKCSPVIPGLEISGVCLPARTVSGDYFDYLHFTPEIVGVVVGDICGKGISAALLMANLQATLRSHVSSFGSDEGQLPGRIATDSTVAKMMEHLNRQMFGFTSPNKFASLFSAVFDRRKQNMTYCNAGHNPPILLRSGKIHRLRAGGTVVGVFEEARYVQESMPLEPGDLMLAYTDGIVEAVNEFGEEFGEERLERLLAREQHLSVETIQDQVIESIVGWSYGQERDDDMTLVVARVKEDWISTAPSDL